MNGSTHLSTWVDGETKRRFGVLAQTLGLSESALLRRSVNLMLQSTDTGLSAVVPVQTDPRRPSRLYVRLRAEDHRLLRERSASRGMAPATYASMLLRSHLRGSHPLPDRELAELKRTVAALGAVGRNLNQIARVGNQGGSASGPSWSDLRQIMRACEGLRAHVKELIVANINAWESDHAEENR